MTEAARIKSTVYVAGLENAVDERILAEAFVPFGDIVEVTLPKPELPSSTDSHRGFGYVEFESGFDAKEAIDNMDQSELYGRVIKVAMAKPQKKDTEALGSKTAIWEQEGYLAKHVAREETQSGLEDRENEDNDMVIATSDMDTAGPKQS